VPIESAVWEAINATNKSTNCNSKCSAFKSAFGTAFKCTIDAAYFHTNKPAIGFSNDAAELYAFWATNESAKHATNEQTNYGTFCTTY
jgi:hypothetical protein